MGKRNKKNLQELYSNPLPLTLSSKEYGALPTLFPHNPLSWIYFCYKYLAIQVKPVPQSLIEPVRVDYENGVFKVVNDEDMNRLWRQGFFGKGTLSRSDPSWKYRTKRRLNLDSDEREMTIEEVTNRRRDERKKFKVERAKLQELELKQRRNEISDDELKELENLKIKLNDLKNIDISSGVQDDLIFDFDRMRIEDQTIVDKLSRKIVKNLEFLQLQLVEIFFLKFALSVVAVYKGDSQLTTRQLFYECSQSVEPKPQNKFILDYVVYHHYRSLGWCVRSGIKFGCDMLLYKRGPPFSHAEFSIMVIPNIDQVEHSWFELSSISRVIGGVKKNLVLAYVDVPTDTRFHQILNSHHEDERELFSELFKLYKVTEILYRRWVPSRTRD